MLHSKTAERAREKLGFTGYRSHPKGTAGWPKREQLSTIMNFKSQGKVVIYKFVKIER